MEQYGPGAAWRTADRPVKTAYMNNTADGILSCTLYLTSFSSTLVGLGNYPAGRLFVTQTTDEEGHITYTFTDNQGQTVLIREMNGSVTNDTYYVYDDLGQLRYVLPPMCDNINEATLDNYAYKYQYDERGNCILIKLPGCDPVTMKYDKADRLIFCQDGNQAGSKWTFFFYDAFGRQTVTGIWNSNSIPALDNLVVKTDYTGTGTLTGYTVNLTLPAVVLMTVNYYDDYSFVNTLTASENAKMPYVSVSGYDAQYTGGAKGLLTGNRTYQVGDTTKYVVSALYYDHRGRVVQSHASNHLGGFEDEYFAYTFTGKVKTRQHVHSIPGNTGTEIYNYTYDHAERLLAVTHQINSSPAVTLATNTYDEVGRLLTKTRAGEQSTYLYNVRSWLTQITGTKFNQTLTYNTAVNNVSPPYSAYNGNISAMKWKAGTETVERGYKFEYDALNRLTAATYGEGTSLTTNSNRYDEKVTLYDKMGNIKNLERRGKADNDVFGVIDNLTYAYTGNKLTKVTDSATLAATYYGAFQFTDGANTDTEYTYDANGNLKKDYNKRIVDIQYNSLNLPNGLQFTNGNTTNYVYDASGQKLSVTHLTAVAGVVIPMTNVMTPLAPAQISSTFKTDYCGNVIYENGAVSKILTDEGYITFTGATPVYHYYLKDHQGNNRVVINQAGTVEQVTHYYPFGGLMGESTSGGVQPYKYNGKELDRVHGLDLFDYGARHYDAVLGRWHSVDPMASEREWLSPYNFCSLNPISRIDPTGALDDWYETPEGEKKYDENIHSAKDMKEKRIEGKYLGKTYKEGDNYYSLFGQVKDLKTMEGKLYEKIDQTLTNYANYVKEYDQSAWEEPIERSADFNIGVPLKKNAFGFSDYNNYTFSYEGATGYYFVYGDPSAMKGKLEWGRDTYSANKNYGFGNMKSGYNTHIYVSKSPRLDIVTLVFPTLNSKKTLYNKWKNEFSPDKK